MAGERGFEPLLYGPEPHVLPLDDSPIMSINMLPENVKRGKILLLTIY